jgi:type VI secretion system protein ImpH
VAPSDRPGIALGERAAAESHAWSFFQLVRALTRTSEGASLPGGPGPARSENLRFRPAASMGFPKSDVESVDRIGADEDEDTERWRVTVNFMGLYGPSSPMPNHFTEEIVWAGADADTGRDFVDLFHHRVISFVYRAWEKYRYPVCFTSGGTDPFTTRMSCLLGAGTAGMSEALGVPPVSLLRTAGLLADRHRSAAGLEQMLRVHFGGVDVRVRSCAERHARIPDAQRLRLGRPGATLGDSAVLGESVIDRAGSFEIELGPLAMPAFRRLLPGGEDLLRLVRLTRLYVTDPLDFHLRLRLRADQVPALRLAPPEPQPLGHLSWMRPHGAREGVALVSVRRVDPLRARRLTALPPPPSEPKRDATTTQTVTPVVRKTPRVTSLRRP